MARRTAREAVAAVVSAVLPEVEPTVADIAVEAGYIPAPEADVVEIPTLKVKEVATPVAAGRAAPNNSEGVKKSWTDQSVRDARSKTHLVTVDGVAMGSARKAFMALYPNASTAARQTFRKGLVAAGGKAHDSNGRLWVIVNA